MRIFVHVNIGKIKSLPRVFNVFDTVVFFFVFAVSVFVCTDPPCIPTDPALAFSDVQVAHTTAVNAVPGTPCIPADVAHAPTAVATDLAGPNAAIAVICRRDIRLL